jgi:hypothetical protein
VPASGRIPAGQPRFRLGWAAPVVALAVEAIKVSNEAFARVKIDQLLRDAGWRLTDGHSVRFEYVLDDGGKADY